MKKQSITEVRAASGVHYGFVLLPRFSSLTLSAMVEPLRIANYSDGRELYTWTYLSADGGDVGGCSGYSVPTQSAPECTRTFDAVIVCGGWNAERFEHAELFRWLKLKARQGTVMGAAEMGSYTLALCGLLDDYATTLHWHCHNAFAERFPNIDLRSQLFVIDRNRISCAGGSACIDMMLHDINSRFGPSLAAEVASQLVYGPARDADQPQNATFGSQPEQLPGILRKAIEHMENNIEVATRIPQLASSLDLSQRKLERLFNRHFGCSAVAYYRKVRLQRARVLLTQTDMSVLDICIACGFASSSYFSKSYAEQYGVRPRDHRLAWPDSENSPRWPGLSTTNVSLPPN